MTTATQPQDFVSEPLENVADGITLKIPTSLDSNFASEFISTLDRLQKQGTKHFVLDMERVLYVNSAAMNFIVRTQDALNKTGGNLLLIKSHPRVRNVFGSLGLDSYLKLFPNLTRGQDYLIQQLGGQAAAARPAAAAAAPAAKVVPPSPAALAPRKAVMPPSPAAPTPRPAPGAAPKAAPTAASGGTGNTRRVAPPTPIGTSGGAAAKPAGFAAFVAVPPNAKWADLVFQMVSQACAGATLAVRRSDRADEAGAKTAAELATAQFVIADLSPDVPGSGQPPSKQVLAIVEAARKHSPPRNVILLIQGAKEALPAELRSLPTVPYQASVQGAQVLKQFLENGLKTLVARASAAPKA